MSAAAWDPRWNLRAPMAATSSAISIAPTCSYASWKRRVQALLEAESVWEVVSEGVVFDEAWPLPKQLEFIQKDKLGMHLILSTVHDSVVALLQDGGSGGADECNRSWLMLKRLEAVFAAHRMKAVRLARREFLDLNFLNFVRANYGGGTGNGGGVDEENDAMLRFIERVQAKADALFRLRGQQPALMEDPSTSSYCEDEKIYQLLDALPASWASFIAQECEGQGDLTWASVQRKVLQEHSKRRAERRKRLLQQGGSANIAATSASAATSAASVASSSGNSRSKTGGANNSSSNSATTAEQDHDDQGSNGAGGHSAPAYQRLGSAVSAFSSPLLTTKAEPPADQSQQQQQHLDDQYDLRSPVDEEVMVYDFVGHQPSDSYPQQQQQQQQPQQQSSMSSYQSQQPSQDQYYDHSSRLKYGNRNNNSSSSSLNNPRNRRDRDNNTGSGGQQRTPYTRPSNQNVNANKICFYCSVPGHTAHHCPLKRMHMEERKKNNNGGH